MCMCIGFDGLKSGVNRDPKMLVIGGNGRLLSSCLRATLIA